MVTEYYSLVFDVGKTHVELHVLNADCESVSSSAMLNRVVRRQPYPHYDTEGIWRWLLNGIEEAANLYAVDSICITTHGATAALVDRNAGGSGLVLPIIDYEYDDIETYNEEYNAIRPLFSETFSPALPDGLNLGRQLYWQQNQFPYAFAKVTDILMYPQYWAWRLTGVACSEITSLGCHTDLWAPQKNDFSTLVEERGWRSKFPDILPAWTDLGKVKPALRMQTGLPGSCKVYGGIHDSNASFLRYRAVLEKKPFAVVSTGTWSVIMATEVPLEVLDERRDMLTNTDIFGRAVACSRSKGGHEYDTICELTGSYVDEPYSETDLQALIDSNVMALPDFSGGSGPFPGKDGRIRGRYSLQPGSALASLYCAMMIDYQLDLLRVTGDIFVEGGFLKNTGFCRLLAQLRQPQQVYLSSDEIGTVKGCAILALQGKKNTLNVSPAKPTGLDGLLKYRERWREAAQ